MNRKEFLELTKEMSDQLFAYELFLRDGLEFDLRYTYHFFEELKELSRLEIENNMLKGVVAYLADGKPQKEIDEFISGERKRYTEGLKVLEFKYKKASVVLPNIDSMTDEDKNELRKTFASFIKDHHPAILYRVTQAEAKLFDMLRAMFYEYNLEGLKEAISLNEFNVQRIGEEQFVEVTKYFYALRQQLGTEINTKGRRFPYTKFKVFEDEITIASERGDLRVSLNKSKGMNQSLHKDLIEAYKEDIKL